MSIAPARYLLIPTILISLLLGSSATAADWPMWRHDASRSATTTEQLPAKLIPQWRIEQDLPHIAWPEDPRLQFDASLQPVVVGKTMLVASSRSDSLTAYDTDSGDQRWQFFAEGPIRFAPIVNNEKVYFGSDDGQFYCLTLDDGKVVWKFRAAPGERRAIGNERLISVWPLRGGPVLHDGKIYFTMGIWPFEGAFLYKLDADSGKVDEMKTLKGLAPQGYLAIGDGKLFIPCGRAKVTCRDLKSGAAVSLSYDSRGKTDHHATAQGKWLLHGDKIYDVAGRNLPTNSAHRPASDEDGIYGVDKGAIVAYDLENPKFVEVVDRRGKKIKRQVLPLAWRLTGANITAVSKQKGAAELRVHIKAGNRLYASHGNVVFAVDIPEAGGEAKISWSDSIIGTPTSMLAANGRLFVVTEKGNISCYGELARLAPSHSARSGKLPVGNDVWTQRAAEILRGRSDKGGYCVALGVGSGRLIDELVRQSELHVIVIESDRKKVDALRKKYFRLNRYGTRVAVHHGDATSFALPPYLASAIVSEDATNLPAAKTIFHALRPYGGTAYLGMSADGHASLAKEVANDKLAKAKIERRGDVTTLTRVGSLPGAADWTHEYGDASNTLMSQDRLVKAPLGVLWFGGPASAGDLFFNRHYWPPSLTVIGGRMFMQGPKVFSAIDIYTGRVLWKIPMPEGHSPGRRGNFFERVRVGYHFVAVDDAIYMADETSCKRLDPATGKTVYTFKMPIDGGRWGRIRIWENLLITAVFEKNELGLELPKYLVAMDRQSGKLIWRKEAGSSAPLVAIGGGKVYYFDGLIEGFYDAWKRKGLVPKAADIRIVKALDARTGKQVWERTTSRVVTWLGYSEANDVLIASNRRGMEAMGGGNGKELWQKESVGKGFRGHPENLWDKVILYGDRIIDQRGPGMSYDIATGKPITFKHPITGKMVNWEFTKAGHHCNYAIASPHMVTFRAASAGFLDMESNTTSRLEGFRSGCRNSLIPAGGVLNAPNFAHGCVCSYQTFTSLALVSVPQAEMWTYSAFKTPDSAVDRVGINFGAPGDRVADSGTMWLDYPNVGGPSPDVSVRVIAKSPRYYRHHTSQISGDGLRWVAASGCEGMSLITLQLAKEKTTRKYKVRLYFAEPQVDQAGQRVFDVSLQGKPVLQDFDVFQAAGGANRLLVKEFTGVEVAGALQIAFQAKAGQPLLCGVEVVAEK